MRHGEEKTVDTGEWSPKAAGPRRDAAVFFMDAQKSCTHEKSSLQHAWNLRMHAANPILQEKNLPMDGEDSGMHGEDSGMHAEEFLPDAHGCRMDAKDS